MKPLLLASLLVLSLATSAAPQTEGDRGEAFSPEASEYLTPAPLSSLISEDPIPLSPKEEEALSLARFFASEGPAPFRDCGGKVVFVHGASVPTIITSPLNVCDIELQPGEALHEVVVGAHDMAVPVQGLMNHQSTHSNSICCTPHPPAQGGWRR